MEVMRLIANREGRDSNSDGKACRSGLGLRACLALPLVFACQRQDTCDQDFAGDQYSWVDVDDCVSVLLDIPPPIAECYTDVFVDASDSSVGVLACWTSAEQQYANCLTSLTCDELEHDNCFDIYNDNLGDCPEMPYETRQEIEVRCYGRERESAFTCKSGERIRMSHKCDGIGECDDASDEEECSG